MTGSGESWEGESGRNQDTISALKKMGRREREIIRRLQQDVAVLTEAATAQAKIRVELREDQKKLEFLQSRYADITFEIGAAGRVDTWTVDLGYILNKDLSHTDLIYTGSTLRAAVAKAMKGN
jgi:hypothetical protein